MVIANYHNNSLLQVLAAQSSKSSRSPHISYRDNKLTYLLKDSLGGNSKAVLIANVSQHKRHEHETMCTLRFAQDAKGLVNHARVNTGARGSSQALKDEVACLKADVLAKVCCVCAVSDLLPSPHVQYLSPAGILL